MPGDLSSSNIDIVQLSESIREQIRGKSEHMIQTDHQGEDDRSPVTSTTTLDSIDREIDALGLQLESGEPSPVSLTLRGRLGALIKHRLYRFLWWQSDQVKALVRLTLRRGREEKNVLDALLQSIGKLNRESQETPQFVRETRELVLECKRQVHASENRLRQLESAQLKLQAADIERNVHARVELEAERASMRDELSALRSALDELRTGLIEQGPEKLADLAQRLEAENIHLAQRLEAETIHLAQQLEAENIQREQVASRLSELGLYTHQTRTDLSLQDRRLSRFIEEARKRLPDPLTPQQVQGMVKEHGEHRYDALYVEFEDVFRGTREEIKSRHTVYLPLLKEHGIGSEAMPLLDLGCGRGEWLELLSEHGLQARGVDRNDEMIDRCQSSGFAVAKGDALSYLASLPSGSLGAVTSFHMVEHMAFDDVLALVDESLRVLKPSGLLILESPNPQNIQVGSNTFYYDPTHLKPVPGPMLRFFVEARGFCHVYVAELQPYPEAVHFPDDGKGITRRLNEFFYGPRDYAVIGRRP